MTNYGYVRVSTKDQNEERQIRKMLDEGIAEENIFVDKASGKDLNRDGYQELISLIEAGDSIILDSLDRLGRNYYDITLEWTRLTHEVGCDIRVLDLDFFDSQKFREMGDMGVLIESIILNLLAYLAQSERNKIKQRQAEGIALAKERGVYKGRKRNEYSQDIIEHVQTILNSGGTKADAAKVLGVTRQTIYRMIDEGRIVC